MVSEMMERPHAVCIPYPAQGHVTPMLKLAKLLHHLRGFYITFVNTEFNHQRLLRSRGPDSLKGLDDFRFETIPDGLPPSDRDATQDIPALCDSTSKNCLAPFRILLTKLNTTPNTPQVTCIISDGLMSFTLDAAEEFRIPEVLFWMPSACGVMCYLHYPQFIDRGLIPLKETERISRAVAIILNTFHDFECNVLDAMKSIIPPIYTVGPLSILSNQIPDGPLKSIGSNLWKEDTSCLEWLDNREPHSVVYVNYGSITVMTTKQLEEFAWGLANSNHPFLWIIRPDLVVGESAMLPPEFVAQTKGKGLLASWCPQEQVLKHPSIGVFLTHCGWNSMLESICGGVPVICWPFFAEQQTNCRQACTVWAIGMEIDNDVKRDEVEGLVREMMEGDKGKEMRKKALEWKELANNATRHGGSSYVNMDKLGNLLASCKVGEFPVKDI